MKRFFPLFLALMVMAAMPAIAEEAPDESPVTYAKLFADLAAAYEIPTGQAIAQIDADAAAMDDEVAFSIAEQWKATWLNPDYHLYLCGADDPSILPITGKHAFVVLGFKLENGEMTDELKGRCDAAAAAALAFPDSILVCSGGATGDNNPEGHTEACLMRDYLTETHGIDPDRIFVDERALTTADNARNTLAILKEQEIETMTIVTSAYHQLRGQTLYNAMAAKYRQEQAYWVEIVGNYCYDAEVDEGAAQREHLIAVFQLNQILGLYDRPAPAN